MLTMIDQIISILVIIIVNISRNNFMMKSIFIRILYVIDHHRRTICRLDTFTFKLESDSMMIRSSVKSWKR